MRAIGYLLISVLALALTQGLADAGKGRHSQEKGNPLDMDGQAEPLLGLTYGAEGLEFQVPSTGCTEKSSFVMQRLSLENQTFSQLLLIRVVPDFCDAYVPFGTQIFYTYDELKLEEDDSFTILNPLSSYRVRSAL
jgi:hypothetical protein